MDFILACNQTLYDLVGKSLIENKSRSLIHVTVQYSLVSNIVRTVWFDDKIDCYDNMFLIWTAPYQIGQITFFCETEVLKTDVHGLYLVYKNWIRKRDISSHMYVWKADIYQGGK